MNFSLRDFIKKGFIDAIGKMPDYWIILNASGYYDKGILTQEDLAEINMAMENYQPEEVPVIPEDETE